MDKTENQNLDPSTTIISPSEQLTTKEIQHKDIEIKENRLTRIEKLKSFLKKRKKLVLGLTIIVFLLVGIIVIILVPKNQQVKITVNDKVAEKVSKTKYDYIYNPNENTLAAATVSGDNYLELINSNSIIVDYAVSPNNQKVAYIIAPKDYKSKITSENADITKFSNVAPVGFELYELNLKTGENKKLWSRESIQLGRTTLNLYPLKTIVHPDSYEVGYYYNTIISYTENGDPFYTYEPVSYTYPISFVEQVEDQSHGYANDYFPYDLDLKLRANTISLIGYDENSENLAVIKENQITVFNNQSIPTNYDFPYSNCYSDISTKKTFVNNTISITALFCSDYVNSGPKVFKIQNGGLDEIMRALYPQQSWLNPALVKDDYALVLSYPNRAGTNVQLLYVNTQPVNSTVLEELKDKWFLEVNSSTPTVAFGARISNEQSSNAKYTISTFDKENKTFSNIGEIELPLDVKDFHYDYQSKDLTYYRNYQASNESIIEYKSINLETKQEKDLKTIKVANSSVLYYKPKLIWLNEINPNWISRTESFILN